MNSPGPLSCFDLGDRMLNVDEARHALAGLIEAPLASVKVALTDGHGRRLADDVRAPLDVPRHTNAAMDGIALRWPATPPSTWQLVGQVHAGQVADSAAGKAPGTPLGPADCVWITTGAALPPGADTVIMHEQLEPDGQAVRIARPDTVRIGQHVRQAGEDIRQGELALSAGTRLDAARLGLLASLGHAEVAVSPPPRVAVFSTGNEVTAPGQPLPEAGVYDINRFTLSGLLREHGADVVDLGILPDDLQAIRAALNGAAADCDLVLTSGGVSVGRADFTRAALESLGELAFWKVAIRPGRPLACGWLGDQRTPMVGLPGNPVAVMVTFLQFVVPLLDRLQGQPVRPPTRLNAVLDERLASRIGRTDFIRGIADSDADGRLHVRSTGQQGSGVLTSMVAANCLIELPDEQPLGEPGTLVTIQPLTFPARPF